MSDEVIVTEFSNMCYTGVTPWHTKGVRLEEGFSSDQAIDACRANTTVAVRPLQNEHGKVNPFVREIYREEDGHVFGACGPSWTPLQNKAAFAVFDPLIDSGELTLETGGLLRGGQKVWILAKIKTPPAEVVKNDEVCNYALLANFHDGKTAVRIGLTPTRVVCANTLHFAMSNELSKLIRVRHSAKVEENVKKLSDALDLSRQEFRMNVDKYQELARHGCNEVDLKKYVKIVFGVDTKKPDDELATRTKNRLEDIKRLFQTGKGNDQEGVRGTYWAAYNALTEYWSYEYGRSEDTRLDSLWFGQNAAANKRALDIALAIVA